MRARAREKEPLEYLAINAAAAIRDPDSPRLKDMSPILGSGPRRAQVGAIDRSIDLVVVLAVEEGDQLSLEVGRAGCGAQVIDLTRLRSGRR